MNTIWFEKYTSLCFNELHHCCTSIRDTRKWHYSHKKVIVLAKIVIKSDNSL